MIKIEKNRTVFLLIRLRIEEIVLTDPNGNIRTIRSEYVYNGRNIEFNLDKKGIYYFNFNQEYNLPIQDESYFFGNAFSTFVAGETFNIDLTEKMYFKSIQNEYVKKDRYVFFYYDKTNYFYYYKNPFEICLEDNCIEGVPVYKFLEGKKYTIKVNFISSSE